MKGHLSASSNEKCSCSMACTPPCIQNLHDLTFELWTFSTAWNCIHVDKTGEEWWNKTYGDALKCHLVNGCESQWLNLSVYSWESIPDFTGFMKSLYEILKGEVHIQALNTVLAKISSSLFLFSSQWLHFKHAPLSIFKCKIYLYTSLDTLTVFDWSGIHEFLLKERLSEAACLFSVPAT